MTERASDILVGVYKRCSGLKSDKVCTASSFVQNPHEQEMRQATKSWREAHNAECTYMLGQGLFVLMMQLLYAAEKDKDLQQNQKGRDRSLQRFQLRMRLKYLGAMTSAEGSMDEEVEAQR